MKNETVTATAPAHWASYLINGDTTEFDYSNTPTSKQGDLDLADAQAFEKWIGGPIIDVSESSFFNTVFVGGASKYITGDMVEYTAIVVGAE